MNKSYDSMTEQEKEIFFHMCDLTKSIQMLFKKGVITQEENDRFFSKMIKIINEEIESKKDLK